MVYRRFGSKYIVRIDKGEEVVARLMAFCKETGIRLGSVAAIGAVDRAEVGLMEAATKRYLTHELTGDLEITSLAGNIATMNGEVYLHLHVTLSDREYHAFGGHLRSARVSGTCEAVIEAFDDSWERAFDEDTGLNLLIS